MKNKRHHILSILLIIFMIFMAVSTSRRPPKEVKNSLSYETRGEYFFIKIRPSGTPDSYRTHDREFVTSFSLFYKDTEEAQDFFYATGAYEIESLELEDETIDDPPFEIYIEGRYFIIKIKNQYLRYPDPAIEWVFLDVLRGGSIWEIYFK